MPEVTAWIAAALAIGTAAIHLHAFTTRRDSEYKVLVYRVEQLEKFKDVLEKYAHDSRHELVDLVQDLQIEIERLKRNGKP